MVFMRIHSHKKWSKIFSGKFGEIRAKILRTPKNLPAPMVDGDGKTFAKKSSKALVNYEKVFPFLRKTLPSESY